LRRKKNRKEEKNKHVSFPAPCNACQLGPIAVDQAGVIVKISLIRPDTLLRIYRTCPTGGTTASPRDVHTLPREIQAYEERSRALLHHMHAWTPVVHEHRKTAVELMDSPAVIRYSADPVHFDSRALSGPRQAAHTRSRTKRRIRLLLE
jgi:hypothetical protein